MLAVIALMAAACGSDPTPTPRPTPTPTAMAEPTPTVSAEAMFQDEWDASGRGSSRGRQADRRGGTSGSRDNRPVWDVFSEKYGIEVIVSGGANRTRRTASWPSNRRGVTTSTSSWPTRSGATRSRRRRTPADGAAVHHPEVLDKSAWYTGDYTWGDPEYGYFFVYSATVSRRNQVSARLQHRSRDAGGRGRHCGRPRLPQARVHREVPGQGHDVPASSLRDRRGRVLLVVGPPGPRPGVPRIDDAVVRRGLARRRPSRGRRRCAGEVRLVVPGRYSRPRRSTPCPARVCLPRGSGRTCPCSRRSFPGVRARRKS